MYRNWSHSQLRDWILDYFEDHYEHGDKIEVSVDTASKISQSLNEKMKNKINQDADKRNKLWDE